MSVIREGEDLIMQLRYKMERVGVFDLFTRAAGSTKDDGTEKRNKTLLFITLFSIFAANWCA